MMAVGARVLFTSVPALVDRQKEVKRIASALEKAKKGNGQLLLFRGEGGEGGLARRGHVESQRSCA